MDGRLVEEWHILEEHLKGTAELGCGEWGRMAGMWHDMGEKRMSEKVYNVFDETKGDVSQVD